MAEQGFDWDKPVTRRDVLHGLRRAGLVAGGLVVAGAVADWAVDAVMDEFTRGPHFGVEQWVQQRRGDARDMPWHTFKGDHGWWGWLRLTDDIYDVGMLAVDRVTMDQHAEGLPPSARHAVVWQRESDLIEVGLLAPGTDDAPQAFPGKYAVGMGVAKGDLRATMGLWVPEGEALIIPENVEAHPMVRTYDMAEKYPGAVWV
jgi:hypothetical protein